MIILKAQLSLNSSDGVRRVLVYNHDHSIMIETADPDEVAVIEGFMPKGRVKCFVGAKIVKLRHGKVLNIFRRVRWRQW